MTPGWTDISGPSPVSFLSGSSMYCIMLTLHNPINPLNVVSANSGANYYEVYKRPETAATCPIKQFRHKIHLSFLPICQEEINIVIFV